MKRRNFLRTIVASSLMITSVKKVNAQVENWLDNNASVPKVYFIKDITSENLIKIYEALGRKAEGKNVAKGTIIECNTAYGGKRTNVADHMKVAEEHGFTAIADVDIMDTNGQVELPVNGGKHLKVDIVGKDFMDYDFMVVLSHFKGHPMAGFGGALKNISIGIASPEGKAYIHSGGKTRNVKKVWDMIPEDVIFQESMAEASKAIIDHIGNRVLYISVANNLSVDCDCVATPADPQMGDLGIFASLDPVALDRASIDAVRNSSDHGKIHLIERIDSKHGMHNLEYAEQLGLGNQKYELVKLD